MRHWTPATDGAAHASRQALSGLIGRLGSEAFRQGLLEELQPLVPAASFSVYHTGARCTPRLYLSGSRGVPDTTRQCWHAYLSGPHRHDHTLVAGGGDQAGLLLCHMAAREAPPLHRQKVYEAHGVAERVSVVDRDTQGVFAINFYRHEGQRAFSASQLGDFEHIAPVLLALVRKHLSLSGAEPSRPAASAAARLAQRRQRLAALEPRLTARELDVCARLLLGMSQEGVAQDLALGLPTVKTYQSRAFRRLGIHFRSQLFALALRDD